MSVVELGVIVGEASRLSAGRRTDPVAWIALRSCLLDPPRAAGARTLAASIQRSHPGAKTAVYAWRHVTHLAGDRLPEGTRKMSGEPARWGHFQASEEVAHAWEVTRIAAEALQASHIVLRTPPSFTPGTLGRRRLEQFVAAHGAEATFVWEPEGLWEPDEAQALAERLGLRLLLPAFRPDGRPEALAGTWLKVDGLGSGGRFSGALADELAEGLAERAQGEDDPLVVLFGGPEPYRGLRALERAILAIGEDELTLSRADG